MPIKVGLNFSDGWTRFIEVKAAETVMDAAMRQGILLPMDCRQGVCGTCRGLCTAGAYDLTNVHSDAMSSDELEQGAVLCCQMIPRVNCVVDFDFESGLTDIKAVETRQAIVSKTTRISDAVAILDLQIQGSRPFDYLPGQYVHLRVPGTAVSRSYSWPYPSAYIHRKTGRKLNMQSAMLRPWKNSGK